MAEPYRPVPSVSIQPKETPKVREHFPEVQITNAVSQALKIVGTGTDVLGGAYQEVGRSYDKLGTSLEGAGDKLFNAAYAMRTLELDKKVDDAKLAYINGNTNRLGKFLANPNPGADGLKAFMKESAESRQKMEDSLQTPYEKEHFRKSTMDILSSDGRTGALHAGRMERKADIDRNDAQITLTEKQLGNPDLPEVDKKRLTDELRDRIYNSWAPAAGKSPQEAEVRWQESQDNIKANNLREIASKRSGEALEKFNAIKDTPEGIHDEKLRTQVYNDIISRVMEDGPQQISKRIFGDNPTIGLGEAEEQARKAGVKYAEKLGLSDSQSLQMEEKAINSARSQWHRLTDAKTEKDSRTQNDALAVINGKNPQGTKYYTMDQVRALDPDLAARIEALPEKMRQGILDVLENPPRDYPETPEAKIAYGVMLASLAGVRGPEARTRAMDVNASAIPGMPLKYQDAIHKEQEKEIKRWHKAEEDPQLTKANQIASQRSLVPDRVLDTAGKDYPGWAGAMIAGLRLEVGIKKRELTDDEIANVISRVTHEYVSSVPGKAYGTTGGEASQLYKLKPDKAQIETIKRSHPGISDQQVTEYFQSWLQVNQLKTMEELSRATGTTSTKR